MVRPGFRERFPARDTQITKALARAVRRLRRERGWTQDDLGAQIGMDQAGISLIENARANPTLETLEALAKTLGVRFVDLFEARASK
jgi:transcriptional regulator with XRE-family HTH domain